MITFAAIMPHPPLSVPGIGRQEDAEKLKNTLSSFSMLREGLKKANPDVVVVISPHGKIDQFDFSINSSPILSGNLEEFGLEGDYMFRNNVEIANDIDFICGVNELPSKLNDFPLDHGAIIPLYHLDIGEHPNVVHLSFSMLDFEKHFEYGILIGKILNTSPKNIAVISSADLSHKLTPDSPAGYSKNAVFFDRNIIDILERDDYSRLMHMQPGVAEAAAECGLRSIIILMGIVRNVNYKFHLLSYEYPFGVGHLTARLI